MRTRKTLIIAGVIMGLLGFMAGCQTLKNAFCSPTAQEVADAADFVANADAVLDFYEHPGPQRRGQRGDGRHQDRQGRV